MKSVIQSEVFEKCEVILINDGSPDRSPEIAQNIANKYRNIKIYHYHNSGLSAARNRGLEHSTGRFVFFLDSDDFLKKDYLCKLYHEAERTESEVIFSGFSKVGEDGKNEKQVSRSLLNTQQIMDGCQFLNLKMDLGDWNNEVCCALYRREFLEENSLKFDEDIKLYEDILFTNKILLYAKKVGTIPIYGYMYRYNEQSLVQGGVKKRDITSSLEVLNRFINIYYELDKGKRRTFGRVFYEHISMILYYVGQVNVRNKQAYYKVLSSNEILKILRSSITTPKEGVKYLIFRYCICLYYPLVRKREGKDAN